MKAGCAHVAAQDVAANASARTPRPVAVRQQSGLFLRDVHYHKSRPTSVLAPRPAPQRGSVAANTAAKDAVKETAASGNGKAAAAKHKMGTASVHGGERQGRPNLADTLTTPIAQNSTYWFKRTQDVIDFQEGRMQSHEYGRYGNPTTRTLEEKIKELENAEECLVSSSGMNAVTTMLLAMVPAGGHIVTTTDCYWRTRQFMQTFLPKLGMGVTVIDPADMEGLKQALDKHKVSLYFSESPTNPYLRCVDIPTVSRLCHEKGAVVCIDSTFATPINQRALELGADLVLHSATKYMAGHNDVLAGALAGKEELVTKVRQMHNILGGVMDPNAAYLVLRGLKTLELRVERHNRTAMEIARRLEEHPKISRVWYPGLESHPDHKTAKAQMGGYGGVISFEVKSDVKDLWAAARFIDACQIPYIAPSLGGVESLIEQPAVQSYWSFGQEGRAKIGIKENLIRFSTGIENTEDIWADLSQALGKA